MPDEAQTTSAWEAIDPSALVHYLLTIRFLQLSPESEEVGVRGGEMNA